MVKKRELTIAVFDAPKGPGNISCYYGTPEVSPIVRGEVVLTTNYNCSGDSISISYRAEAIIAFKEGAVTHSGSNLYDEESFKFETVHPLFFSYKTKAGTYKFPFSFRIKSTIPSSFLNEFAFVSFALQAKLIRKYSKDIVKTEPLWVTNTLLPRYYDPPPPFTPTATPTTGPGAPQTGTAAKSPPTAATLVALLKMKQIPGMFAEQVPFDLIFPGSLVYWGQQFSFTVRIHPAINQAISSTGGPIAAITSVELFLRQHMSMRASSGQTKLLVRQIFEKVAYGGWPLLTDGQLWTHTMVVDVPNTSASAPSVNLPCLHMEFKLHVILVLKMKNGTVRELGTSVALDMTAPRPSTERSPPMDMVQHLECIAAFPKEPILSFQTASRFVTLTL
ncbi:hypothetical protein BGZ74_000286 [Mortierella antarctica]|nr:hypothetical protein BGZ74_000286 [Mortierella antarctica]